MLSFFLFSSSQPFKHSCSALIKLGFFFLPPLLWQAVLRWYGLILNYRKDLDCTQPKKKEYQQFSSFFLLSIFCEQLFIFFSCFSFHVVNVRSDMIKKKKPKPLFFFFHFPSAYLTLFQTHFNRDFLVYGLDRSYKKFRV